jgi:hypothetical protein
MATSALQLRNSSGDPRGRRYTDGDRSTAYRVWTVTARRSYARASVLTGVAENTLRSWALEDGWSARAAAEDEEAAESIKVVVMAAVVAEQERSIATLVALRDTATNERVRLDAALALLGIGGIGPKSVAVGPKEPAKPAKPDLGYTIDDWYREREAGRPLPTPEATVRRADEMWEHAKRTNPELAAKMEVLIARLPASTS